MFKFYRRKGFWLILITALVLLTLIQLSSQQRREISALEGLVQKVFFPLQNGVDKLNQGFVAARIRLVGGSDLQAQIESLKSEVDRLTLENMQLRESKARAKFTGMGGRIRA